MDICFQDIKNSQTTYAYRIWFNLSISKPRKDGSTAERLSPCLQGHSRSRRDFSRKGASGWYKTMTPSQKRWGHVNVAWCDVLTIDNIDIFNVYPQKVGSDSEPSRGRLQVRSKGSARPFWEKEKQTNTPSFRWGIVSGACSDVAPPVGLEPTTLRLTAACSTNWAKEASLRIYFSIMVIILSIL